MQFQKGQSGNPAGRARGARNKASVRLQEMLEQSAEALFNKAVEMAMAGNIAALRLCLEPLLPTHRNEPLFCEMATFHHELPVISLLFPCSSLFLILPFRQMSLFILTFLQISAVAPPPLQGFTGRGSQWGAWGTRTNEPGRDREAYAGREQCGKRVPHCFS